MSKTVAEVRAEFPEISDEFVYFDNSATTFKPLSVIEAVDDYYRKHNSNVHRGIYDLSVRVTELYEGARKIIKDFVGADDSYEVIFTRNTTEAINVVAQGLELNQDDEVIVSDREHHSNLLPWNKNGTIIKNFIPNENLDDLQSKLNERVKVISTTAWSNILGKVTNLQEILELAKQSEKITLVDAAQWVINEKVSMKNIDFLAFSGHKMYAPMGIGALVARRELLKMMKPVFYGGDMVEYVHSADDFALADIPHRFEAGTPNIGGVVGLTAAINWIKENGYFTDEKHELYRYAREQMRSIPHVNLLPGDDIICLTVEDVHPHDVAQCLNNDHIFVRSGYHCAQPILEKLGCGPVTRVSLACYNTHEEIDRFLTSLKNVRQKMGIANV